MPYNVKHIRRNDYSVQKGDYSHNIADCTASGMNLSNAAVAKKATWANHNLQGSVAETFVCYTTNGVSIITYGKTGTSGALQVTVNSAVTYGTGGS